MLIFKEWRLRPPEIISIELDLDNSSERMKIKLERLFYVLEQPLTFWFNENYSSIFPIITANFTPMRTASIIKFIDRHDAGLALARILEDRYKNKNVLVLGIPRGGVVVASTVAQILNGEMSVVITKKLPHPRQSELAIGSAAEDGSTYLNSHAQDIDRDTISKIVEAQLREIKSRVHRFRNGKPLPRMFNRIVIIIDDGIATGSTIVPAIKLCKSMKAAKVIVAAPVSAKQFVSEVHQLADEVIIAEQPEHFNSVGDSYNDFHPLTDEEVKRALTNYRRFGV